MLYRPSRVSQTERGFTLVELLVGLTIISIIALFAIPAYQDYLTRTMVISEMPYIRDLRVRLNEYYMYKGVIPSTNADAGFKAPKDYAHGAITKIYLSNDPVSGSLIVEFKSEKFGADNLLIYTPVIHENGLVDWSCTASTISSRYLPDHCTE